MILELGERLDKELKNVYGTTCKYQERVPYTERAKRYVRRMISTKPTKEETILFMSKAGGLATEERLPIIIFGLGGEVKNYRIDNISRTVNEKKVFTSATLDLLDAVTHKMTKWWREALEKGNVPDKFEVSTIEQFMALVRRSDSIKFMEFIDEEFAAVAISDGEIRDCLGKPHWSSCLIKGKIKNIGRWSLDGEVPVFSAEDGWINVPLTGGFAEVLVASEEERYFKYRSDRLLRGEFGKGREENVYVVRFIGTWGTAYALSVFNRNVRLFPKRFYTDLSKNAKMLFRAVCGKEGLDVTFINIIQIAKILDWRLPLTNISQRISIAQGIWKELYTHGFIIKESLKRYKDKEEAFWCIKRRKDWFNPPKELDGAN